MIDDALWQPIAAGLPAFLDRQRWYADKLRPISAVRLVDVATVEFADIAILLALVGIDYETGDSRRYFVPMTVRREPASERTIVAIADVNGTSHWVQDAIGDQAFRDFVVNAGAELTLGGQHGHFAFEPWMMDGQTFSLAPDTPSTATAFEQSNSSITFGEQAIAKLYRRLEVGQNIEVDMNRYLASEAGFAAVPKLIAAATYRSESGDIPLMLVQQHVGDHRDAWTALTDLLRHKANRSLDIVEGLGRVTGDMHVALASAAEGSQLAPEPISEWDIRTWRDAFMRSAEETDWITAERLGILPRRSQQAAREYLATERNWEERSSWFELLGGLYKTRVHGDYHLGQILVTKAGRLLVVDFEGEPHRPAYERAAMYSPLRDVAGMLRSLNYATGVVASSHDVQAFAVSRSWLEHWEQEARALYISAYRRAISDSPVPIAPTDDEAFGRVISALETDKAFYEVRYELNSRPDWAWLPLDSLK